MSKYTDIAAGRTKPTIPVIKRPVLNNTNNAARNAALSEDVQRTNDMILQLQDAEREKTRNPIAYKLMQGGKKISNKVLGKGWFSDLIGSLPGGIVRSYERPLRSLVGSGYMIGQGVKGLSGDVEANRDWAGNVNPFMTPDDVAGMKSTDNAGFLAKKSVQLAGDTISAITGPGKDMTLRGKLIVGGAGGAAGALAEENPTIRSVAEGTAFGAGTAGAGHYASKAFGKLRSGKVPDVPATSPDLPTKTPDIPLNYLAPEKLQIEGPTSKIDVDTKGGDTLYHELSPASSIGVISSASKNNIDLNGKFVSREPSLAQGQGGKGIVLEIDAGLVNTKGYKGKPGLDFIESSGGVGEEILTGTSKGGPGGAMIGSDSIKSIIVKPTAKLSAVERAKLNNKWIKGETLADGSVRYYNPGYGGGNKLPPSNKITSLVPEANYDDATKMAINKFGLSDKPPINKGTFLTKDGKFLGASDDIHAALGPDKFPAETGNLRMTVKPNELNVDIYEGSITPQQINKIKELARGREFYYSYRDINGNVVDPGEIGWELKDVLKRLEEVKDIKPQGLELPKGSIVSSDGTRYTYKGRSYPLLTGNEKSSIKLTPEELKIANPDIWNQANKVGSDLVTTKPTGLETTTPAIEGEIVDKSGLIKSPPKGVAGKPAPMEGFEPINKRLGPLDTSTIGVKSLLNKFGNPGKKLSSMLDEFENRAHVSANTAYNAFNKVLKDFEVSTKGSKLPLVGSSKNIVQYILDEYNHVPHKVNISPKEKAVAEMFYKMVTLPTSLKAKEYNLKPNGKTIGPARMFLPQIIKDKTKWTSSMMDKLIGEGNTADEAARIVNAILGDSDAPPINTRKASFEHAKSFFPKTVEELEKFGYETDIRKIAAKWSKDSWRRVAALDAFGPLNEGEHTGAAAEFMNMLKGGANQNDVDILKKNFLVAVEGAPKENELIQGIGKVARAYGGTKIGPSVAIQQPSTLGQVAAIAGEGRTIKSIIKQTATKLGLTKVPDADKALVDNAGVVLQDGLDDILRAEYGSGGSQIVNAIEKVSAAKFKLTGVTQLDTAVRKVSAYASLDWIKNSVKKLSSGKLSKKAYDSLYDEIKMFAIPTTSELDDIIANGGKMSSFQTSKAIYQFGKKTQYGLSRAELPATWSGSTLGRVATQLKSFGYEQMQMYARLAAHGKKTGNWKPLIKSIGYTVGINAASAKVISMLYGTDEQKKDQNVILDALGQTVLGIFYNTLKYSGSGGEAVGNLILGPTGGDVANLGFQSIKAGEQELSNLGPGKNKHTSLRTLGKTIYKKVPPFNTVSQLPYVGPKITEELFPSLRSSSLRR